MNRSRLLEKRPRLKDSIPWISLGVGQTPVMPMHLDHEYPGSSLWVKREDLTSDLYGGNKVRKLEFLLAKDEKPVITVGATGSHHVLATAIYSNILNRPCYGILVPQAMTSHHREVNKLILEKCQGVLSIDPRYPDKISSTSIRRIVGSRGFCFIEPGGSSPSGILGYVSAGLELAEQIKKKLCPEPELIFVPFGTGGTAAGLALGLALEGIKSRVLAVRVVPKIAANMIVLGRKAMGAYRLLERSGLELPFPAVNLQVDHHHYGKGYAHPSPESISALKTAKKIGLSLETTYSAKVFAAMIDYLKANPRCGPLLFIMTAGKNPQKESMA